MWLGSLSLAGIPPFAGFFSKDVILESAFEANQWLYVIGTIGALLTAFYSFRVIFLAFHGQRSKNTKNAHEAPLSMKLPVIALGLGAMVSGFAFSGLVDIWHTGHPHPATWVKILPCILAVLGIGLATFFYLYKPALPQKCARLLFPMFALSRNKFYIDEIYHTLLVRPFRWLGLASYFMLDKEIIDGIGVNGAAQIIRAKGWCLRFLQSGHVAFYSWCSALGTAGLLGYVLWELMKVYR